MATSQHQNIPNFHYLGLLMLMTLFMWYTHQWFQFTYLNKNKGTRRNIHPLTPIMVINHSLSAFSIYYDPWHPPCSIYMLDSLFPQSLSKFSLVYLLAWHPPLHTIYVSSPNHCLLFAAHAQCPYYRNMFRCSTETVI